MYTFVIFVRDQSIIGLRVAEDHVKQFCGGENVVACAFVDIDGVYADARENVYNHLYTMSKMVYLTHTSMVKAIMDSNADYKIMPCGPFGRGLKLFFDDFTAAITIIIGDIDANSETIDKIFVKSDYVVWISRKPVPYKAGNFMVMTASCETSDGQAFMSVFRTMDLSDE
jgi:hypothetical protein